MGGEGTGEANWVQGCIQSVSKVGNENRYTYEHCGAINGLLACIR